MTAAMAKRAVEYRAVPCRSLVKDWNLRIGSQGVGKIRTFAFEASGHQNVDIGGAFTDVELILDREIAQTSGQRMIVANYSHRKGSDWRMAEEAGAEHLHELRRLVRRQRLAVGSEADDRVGAVERDPAAAPVEKGAQRGQFGVAGDQVASIGDQDIAGRNPLAIYLFSELFVTALNLFPVGGHESAYAWAGIELFQRIAPGAVGSLLCAIAYTMLCWIVGWLLDRKGIIIKV